MKLLNIRAKNRVASFNFLKILKGHHFPVDNFLNKKPSEVLSIFRNFEQTSRNAVVFR